MKQKNASAKVFEWRGHILRAENQDQYKRQIVDTLNRDETFIIVDWTMNFIPFTMITVCSLQLQLALLKPLANFFAPILFCSQAFQFVYNLEKSLKPSAPSAAVFSKPLQNAIHLRNGL